MNLSLVTGLATALCVATTFSGAAYADQGTEADLAALPVVRALPLAAHLVTQGDLAKTPDDALAQYAQALLDRFMLDEQTGDVQTTQDLHNLVVLELSLEILAHRGVTGAGLGLAQVQSALLLHGVGHAYSRDGALKGALSHLVTEASPAAKAPFQALGDSVPKMRHFGRLRFPKVLQAALKTDRDDPRLHNLRGVWLREESRPKEAAQAFRRALAGRASLLYAVNLYDALLAVGDDREAARVRARVLEKAPGRVGQLDHLQATRDDHRATRRFERAQGTASVEDSLGQVHRYRRTARLGDADVLLTGLKDRAPDHPAVTRAAITTWLDQGRWVPVESSLTALEALPALPLALVEARVAAVARARLSKGAADGRAKVARRDITADLRRLSAADDPALRRAAHGLKIFLAATAHGQATGAVARQDALVRLDEAIRDGRASLPADGELLIIAATGYLATGQAKRAQALLGEGAGALPRDARGGVTLLLGRLEVARGTSRRDTALLETGLARLRDLPPSTLPEPGQRAARRHAITVGEEVVSSHDREGREGRQRARLEALQPLLERLDPRDDGERLQGQATAASIGALAVAVNDRDLARQALLEARRRDDGTALGALLAAQGSAAAEDLAGAASFLATADDRDGDASDRLRFAVAKWRALVANRQGDGVGAADALRTMLARWDDAGAPRHQPPGRTTPLVTGLFRVAVHLPAQAGLTLDLEAEPVVVLTPDFAHDRDEIEALVARLPSAAPPPGEAP